MRVLFIIRKFDWSRFLWNRRFPTSMQFTEAPTDGVFSHAVACT